jgi:hypothetical protein
MRFRLITALAILIALVNGSFAQSGTIQNYVFDCQTSWQRSEDQLRTSSMLLIVKLLIGNNSTGYIKDFIVVHNLTNGVSIVTSEGVTKTLSILPKELGKGWGWKFTNPSNPAYIVFGMLLENPPGNFSYTEGYAAANNPQQHEETLRAGCRWIATQ